MWNRNLSIFSQGRLGTSGAKNVTKEKNSVVTIAFAMTNHAVQALSSSAKLDLHVKLTGRPSMGKPSLKGNVCLTMIQTSSRGEQS